MLIFGMVVLFLAFVVGVASFARAANLAAHGNVTHKRFDTIGAVCVAVAVITAFLMVGALETPWDYVA